jgi:membrane associated rhomboid family serine protease
VAILAITLLFHRAMMGDPANIQEFARSAHHVPTAAELSSFLYTDALGGGLNHLWIGPLLGVTVGAGGAIFGKWQRQSEASASAR